jgi:hypothetical protein
MAKRVVRYGLFVLSISSLAAMSGCAQIAGNAPFPTTAYGPTTFGSYGSLAGWADPGDEGTWAYMAWPESRGEGYGGGMNPQMVHPVCGNCTQVNGASNAASASMAPGVPHSVTASHSATASHAAGVRP